MRKKVIASIILIIMLWQSFGNLCIAFVNSADESNNSIQETNNVVSSRVNEVDNETETDDVVSDNKVEADNTENSDDKSEIDNTVIDSKVEKDDNVSSEDKVRTENIIQNTNIEIGDQYITEDDLLYSNKYLVKDKVVSRIDPKTTILEFKKKVEIAEGNELSFYKKDGITQLTEGILGTGMIVRGTNGQEYRLSIKGDMTGEGEANQVELTMMIRHLIELQGWELTDINVASGDITGDGEINLVDINKMIKHIVFGDWEYDDRTTPNPPTIEALGNEGEEADLYTSEVRVRIVEDKTTENSKTTYKISGKVEKEESSIEENEEIKIKEDGEYLITAYTYGIQGNRSRASNRRIVISKTEEPDKPEVYNITYELNGGVNNSENPATYTYGTETIFKDPTREGYTFEGWYKEAEFTNRIEKIEATQKGNITVYAKWRANVYNITYELNGGENDSENPSTYTYGTETIFKNPTREGYRFEGWYKEAEFTNKIEKIEATQTGDVTVYAKWSESVYNIIYELKGGENNSDNPSTYTYGTEIIFKDPTKVGHTFEGWYKEAEFTNKIEKIEATQKGDITVYAKWKQNEYQITGEAKEGGIIENAEETVKYGENSTKQIIITPNRNKVVDSITINGIETLDYEEDQETGIVTLPIFENVTEDKHVIAIFRQLEIVAVIVDAPAGYEDLIGKEYISIKRALKDITVDGVTIQLIANTNEEFTLTNYQVTLDLNGKTVTGDENTAIIESGSLTLINSSSTQGKIISNAGCAVYIKDGGKFNLGQNEGTVEIDSMLIQGETIGVNNEGIFNFYDGTIKGTTAIKGDVDEAPLRYNASVTADDNQQIAKLEVMAGAEAAIGGKTFFKLEDAIAYANEEIATDGCQVEITVISDISRTVTVEISENKNVKINLNGYEIAFSNTDTGIENKGKLELVNKGETGRIIGKVTDVIKNYNNAELTITSGIIEVDKAGEVITNSGGSFYTKYCRGIYNLGTAIINGGTIKTNKEYNKGISSTSAGTVIVNGGIIQINGDNSYGIDGGAIVINGGEIQIQSTVSTYAIYAPFNNDYGTIVNNGEIIGNININNITINNGNIVGNIGAVNIAIKNGSINGDMSISQGSLEVQGGKIQSYIELIKSDTTISGGEFLSSTLETSNKLSASDNVINITGGMFTSTSIQSKGTTPINISGGEFTSEYRILNFDGYTSINITGGTFVSTNNSVALMTISQATKVDIQGATFESQGACISIENSAEVSIGSGVNIISNTDCGISNEFGTITVGEKDGVVDTESIKIEGKTYGVYNFTGSGYDTSINFYDGQIIGAEGQSIFGTVDEVEDNCIITKTLEDSREIAKLEEVKNFKIVETDSLYSSIQDAIDDIDSGNKQTIQVLNNAIVPVNVDTNIPEDKSIVLDLNGKELELKKDEAIINNGLLEIIDTSENNIGVLELTGTPGILNQENATLKIISGTITEQKMNNVMIQNKGELQIDGGTIETTYENVKVVYNQDAGNVIINGGIIDMNSNQSTCQSYGIYSESTGEILITEGTINVDDNNSYGIYNENAGDISIKGGMIKATGTDSYGIYNINSECSIIIEEGKIYSGSSIAIRNKEGSIKIIGGTITAKFGISNGNFDHINEGESIGNASVLIEGGSITSVPGSSSGTGIINGPGGVVDIVGGHISVVSYGVYNIGGTTTLEGATITSDDYGLLNVNSTITNGNYEKVDESIGTVTIKGDTIIDGKNYGVYIIEGNITIGEKDGNVDILYPEIRSDDYGVHNSLNGTINFYDGKIIGTADKSIYGSINEVEEEYDILKTLDEDENTETAVLDKVIIIKNTTTNIEYSNIQKAITEAQNGEILQVQRSITMLSSQETVEVGTEKNIILDLNGYNLEFSQEVGINNSGTLTITNTSNNKTACLINSSGNIITNETDATLEINNVTMTGGKFDSSMVNNKGILQLNEVIISSSKANVYLIYNQEDGKTTINSGELTTTASGSIPINISSGEVLINGTKISGGGNYNIYNEEGIVNIINEMTTFDGAMIYNGGIITVEDGTITSKYDAIRNDTNGTVIVKGGTISGGNITSSSTSRKYYGIINNYINQGETTVIVEGGTIVGRDGGIKNTNRPNTKATVTVTGGTVSNGIYNEVSGELTIIDGTVNGAITNTVRNNDGIRRNYKWLNN